MEEERDSRDDHCISYTHAVRKLIPDAEPHAGILDDHIKENEIPRDTCGKRDRHDIDDFVAAFFRFVYRAYPLLAPQVPYDRDHEQDETCGSKQPAILPVERVGKRCREGDGAESKENDDNRRKAA